MPQLNEFDCNRCEGIITKRECWDAFSSMNNNKSPRNDDLSKTNCDNINTDKGRHKRYIQNWRPVSLINVDAKVASKSLALRLKKVTHALVDSHPTAYVPGHNLGESVRLAEDLFEHDEKRGSDRYNVLFRL